MIKINELWVGGWEAAFRGMRNPLNSHKKADSYFPAGESPIVGGNDTDLAKRLAKAGPEHGKFLRMIHVSMDITAPVYWVQELDTYKVSTTRNSSSVMHKGTSRPFTIRDFSVPDERLYEVLDPVKETKEHALVHNECAQDEYKTVTVGDRAYKVFCNGRVIACEFYRADTAGVDRTKHFEEKELRPTQNQNGYWYLNLGGRAHHRRILLHRLVAEAWLQGSYFDGAVIDHIDGNKGNNSVCNLRWVTRSENEKNKRELNPGLYQSLSYRYKQFKNNIVITDRTAILNDLKSGKSMRATAEDNDCSLSKVADVKYGNGCEDHDLFEMALVWESVINEMNRLRDLCVDDGDESAFLALRQIMPMSYNYLFTWDANYAVLRTIYHQRRNHRLPEWQEFCDFIETLPYSELITEE